MGELASCKTWRLGGGWYMLERYMLCRGRIRCGEYQGALTRDGKSTAMVIIAQCEDAVASGLSQIVLGDVHFTGNGVARYKYTIVGDDEFGLSRPLVDLADRLFGGGGWYRAPTSLRLPFLALKVREGRLMAILCPATLWGFRER